MSTVVITVKTSKDPTSFYKSNQDHKNMARLINLLSGLNVGANLGDVYVQGSTSDPVAASGTFTLVSAIATDLVVIGTETLTASSTPANENQWEIDGASNTLDAASLAACINAHSVLSKQVVATSALGVVTVTALQKGVVGNMIPISSPDTTITESGAFLTGGTGGATSSAEQVR